MAKKDGGGDPDLILRNKKAFHEYEILETIECGVALTGSEVKSIRERNVSYAQSYAFVDRGELLLVGLNISIYKQANILNHAPERKRKLLAHRREIRKLQRRVEEKGLTLVPLRLYWKRGKCKVEIGVARGKQLHDKRAAKRDRDLNRQIERETRGRR